MGMTQGDLVEPLGVRSRSAVGHYLAGRRQLTVEQGIILAELLDVSMDWLYRGDEHAGEPSTDLVLLMQRVGNRPRRVLLELADLLTHVPESARGRAPKAIDDE